MDLLCALQITWIGGDTTGDGIAVELEDVLSLANSHELHSTDEWSVPALADGGVHGGDSCDLQFWHGDDSYMSGSTVSLSQVVQTTEQGAGADEADQCWWLLDRREAAGMRYLTSDAWVVLLPLV